MVKTSMAGDVGGTWQLRVETKGAKKRKGSTFATRAWEAGRCLRKMKKTRDMPWRMCDKCVPMTSLLAWHDKTLFAVDETKHLHLPVRERRLPLLPARLTYLPALACA